MTDIAVINRMQKMCEESLDPDTFDKWINVRTELLINRKSIKTEHLTRPIMKAITYNKENECDKQDGIAPADILYAGPIDGIKDSDLAGWGIGYMDLAEMLKQANGSEDEDFVSIVLSDDGI